MQAYSLTDQTRLSKFLFTDIRLAWVWLLLRLYVGWLWLSAGWEKIHSSLWTGQDAGLAIQGFLQGALKKTAGDHPDVSQTYAYFIEHVALPHAAVFSYLVSWGELAIGMALLLGLVTGIAAFFGIFLNFNYLFAGTVSINPLLLLIQLFILLAWRTAGWYGLDRFLFHVERKRGFVERQEFIENESSLP